MVKQINSKTQVRAMKDWHKIEYFVPLTESLKSEDNKGMKIKGVAINECTTRNGVSYRAEELELAAPSLRNRPVLKDHNNSVDSIVGKTTENVFFDRMNKNISFEAMIMDPKMCEMISQGLIGSVSIGAMVHDVSREEEGGPLVARGIDFVEISLVAVPADPNAGFEKAIAESFNMKQATIEVFDIQDEILDVKKEEKIKEETKMADEQKPVQLDESKRVLEEQNSALLKKVQEFENKELAALHEQYKDLASKKGVTAKEGLSKEVLTAVIETLKSLKDIEVRAEEKPIAKGEVSVKETSEEKKIDFVLERSDNGRGYAMYSDHVMNPRYTR